MGLYKGNSNRKVPGLLLGPLPKFNLCLGPTGQAAHMYVSGSLKKAHKIKKHVNEMMLGTPAGKPNARCTCLTTARMV